MTIANVVDEMRGSLSAPKPQARPRRIDIAMPPATPTAAVAVAACPNRRGNGFRYRAVGTDRTWAGTVATTIRDAAILEAMTAIRADMAEIDRVRFLVSIAGTSPLWRCQDEIARALPGASIEWPATTNLALMEAAQHALTEPVGDVGSTPRDISPLTVATDGSVRHGYTGIGWLACDGQYGLSGFRHTGKEIGSKAVLISELRAIIDAVCTLRDRPLTLASDSTSAIHMIEKWMKGHDVLPNGYNRFRIDGQPRDVVVAQQTIHAERDRLTLVWVRGHRGEPLNEGADALARLARRRAANPTDLSADEYQRRAADLAQAFAFAFNRSRREDLQHGVI